MQTRRTYDIIINNIITIVVEISSLFFLFVLFIRFLSRNTEYGLVLGRYKINESQSLTLHVERKPESIISFIAPPNRKSIIQL